MSTLICAKLLKTSLVGKRGVTKMLPFIQKRTVFKIETLFS